MAEPNIIQQDNPPAVVTELKPHLLRTAQDQRPIVLMTCGIAGSGKTTLAKAICDTLPSFHRLSNDEIIASRHGIYGIDYDAHKYDEYQDEADQVFLQSLRDLLKREDVDVVLDRSFYAKEYRDEFKALVESHGARWVLVYFKMQKELLWRRICERREKEVNANSALDISRELFEKYVRGFEHPNGEGEIVVEYTQ